MSYQLYRNTTLGNTLQESLDELIQVIILIIPALNLILKRSKLKTHKTKICSIGKQIFRSHTVILDFVCGFFVYITIVYLKRVKISKYSENVLIL